MKIIFAGDISFDWMGRPGPAATLTKFFAGSSLSQELRQAIAKDSPYPNIKHRYRLMQAEKNACDITKHLKALVSGSDLFCANLECPLSFRGEPITGKRYTLRAEPYYTTVLKNLGITHVSLANNHILDFGPEALDDTRRYLNLSGIGHFGLRDGAGKQQPQVIEYDYNRLVLLGYVEPSIITPAPDVFFLHRPSPTPLEPEMMLDSVKEKSASAAIIVVLHWGIEWSHLESQSQRDLAHRLIDAGAKAVIGHHSHLVGRVEEYNHGLIAYGLGNLMMTLPPLAFKRSSQRALLEVDIRENSITGYRIIPLDYNRAGYPVPGDFDTESLMLHYRPRWFPAEEAILFDSNPGLESATVTAVGDNSGSRCSWSDDYLIVEDLPPLYRLPMGPGWRSTGPKWTGVSQGREFLGNELVDTNLTYLENDDSVHVSFDLKPTLTKITAAFGFPRALQGLHNISCAGVEVKIGGSAMADFNVRDLLSGKSIKEILLPAPSNQKLEITFRSGGKKYSLVCWRIWSL